MRTNTNQYILESFDYKSHDVYICGTIIEEIVKEVAEKINDIINNDKLLIRHNTMVLNDSNLFTDESKLVITLPPINIYLTSYGGGCYSGLGIYDIIKNATKEYNVNIICSGYVMSAGTLILQAGTKRIARKNTTFMVHELADFAGYEKLADIKERVDEDNRLSNVITNIYLEHTKFTVEKLNEIYEKKQDFYLSADEALEYGLIDEIID